MLCGHLPSVMIGHVPGRAAAAVCGAPVHGDASTRSAVLGTILRWSGTWARAGMLALAWALGAQRATTSWRAGNHGSQRVSEKLGYQPNGVRWHVEDGRELEELHAYVTPALFAAAWSEPVQLTGVGTTVQAWARGQA